MNPCLIDKWPGHPSRRHSEFRVKAPASMVTGDAPINSRSRASYVDEENISVQFWRSKGNNETSIVHEERKRALVWFQIFIIFGQIFDYDLFSFFDDFGTCHWREPFDATICSHDHICFWNIILVGIKISNGSESLIYECMIMNDEWMDEWTGLNRI